MTHPWLAQGFLVSQANWPRQRSSSAFHYLQWLSRSQAPIHVARIFFCLGAVMSPPFLAKMNNLLWAFFPEKRRKNMHKNWTLTFCQHISQQLQRIRQENGTLSIPMPKLFCCDHANKAPKNKISPPQVPPLTLNKAPQYWTCRSPLPTEVHEARVSHQRGEHQKQLQHLQFTCILLVCSIRIVATKSKSGFSASLCSPPPS